MKTKLKIIFGALSLALLALTTSAQTTFTNGVKGSALPYANTPLGGSEVMFLIQSNTTKQATVAQVTAALTAGNLSTSNYFALVTSSNASALNAASNYLASANVTNANNLITVSNAVAALAVAASAKDTITSNAIVGLLPAYYPSNNPAGFQNAAQVTAAASTAVANYAALGITNTGSATLGNVFYVPAAQTNGASVTVDLSKASLQFIKITNNSPTSLFITNQTAGQNVTVDLYNNGGGTFLVTYPPNCLTQNGSTTFGSLRGNSHAIVSFLVVGTNVFCSSTYSFY
jgi:hypothetical protein